MLKPVPENTQANMFSHMCLLLRDISLIYMYVYVMHAFKRCAYSMVYKWQTHTLGKMDVSFTNCDVTLLTDYLKAAAVLPISKASDGSTHWLCLSAGQTVPSCNSAVLCNRAGKTTWTGSAT